jgi:hypothetical protein
MSKMDENLRAFEGQVDGFHVTLLERELATFVRCVAAVGESIKVGSPVTGAPGQPVDQGALIGSWQESFPEEWVGRNATNMEYAPPVEEGQQEPYTTASGREVTPRAMVFGPVGGAHSVALTRANWPQLADSVVRSVASE